jgi:hypothetical protein
MSRESKPTNYVYRVTIEHLYADGSGHYMERTYGPYTTLTAAKSQQTRLLNMARMGGKKANSYIEEAWLEWELSS